ncbi:CHAT domain-containing protein [Intrasporangium sp. YIM S08009]|uniref:CHAT domain-containing protein n=1 Tax=Intrasporangium zincisolvens TaxID=3080018 RepID=UPI002B053F29|nr:CHAT domain-containing protein [Intrasporangium sp. YIM S08009]
MRARTLTTLALTEFLLEGADAAHARFAEVEQIVDSLGDDDLRARLAYQRANVAGRGGDLAGARAGLEGAMRRLDAFSPREQCSVLLSRGMLAFEMSEPAVALDAFSRAAATAREGGWRPQEFMAAHNEGYAAYLLGDVPRALATMAAAVEDAPDVSLLPARLDRAHVLLEAGLIDEAVEVIVAAAASPDAEQDQVAAELQLRLSRAHRHAGNLARAGAAAELAVEGFDRVGALGWAAKARLALVHVELDRLRRGSATDGVPDAAAVLATAEEVTATAARLGDTELGDSALVAAADAHLLAGRVEAARTCLDAVSGPGASLTGELDRAVVEAGLHVAAGEPARARRVLGRAARGLAAGQEGSASLDLRSARALHGVRLARIDLALALRGGSSAVLEALDRWRNATDRLPSLGRPDDEALASLTEQLRSTQALLRGDVPAAEAADLTARVRRLERDIRARDWTLSSGSPSGTAAEVRVRQGREALDRADRDLLWFFPDGDRLMGVGVVGGRARVRDLMPLAEAVELAHRIRVDLRTAATRELGPFAQAVWGSLRAAADRLDAAAVRPWGLRRSGLVVVTCEEVSALPWSLLPSLAGVPFTVASSLTSFARRADSVNGVGVPAAHGNSARVHVSVGPSLRRASGEASAVAQAWADHAEVTVAEPSAARGLVEAMGADDVVHVAAHGTHQVQSPLFSSVHLHDGPVFAHELQVAGVRARHVVLSACEVGSATFRPGEEQLGLAAAVLSLGARSAVAAVSPVPDEVAADTMVRHHRALARGVPSDEALASALAAGEPIAAAFLHLGGRFTHA